MRDLSRTVFALAMVVLLVGSASVAAVAQLGGAVNHSADSAPSPEQPVTVTKSTQNASWNATAYENNNGELDNLQGFTVNESADNPYAFTLTDVDFQDAGAFPHDKDDVSGLDADEWTTDVSSSAGTATVSDVTTAPGVDAVGVTTSSQTSGDTAIAEFSNFSVTSDVEKRYVQVAYDVGSVDSGTSLELRVVDGDGDYYSQSLEATAGEGYLHQEQLGNMSATSAGNGDGVNEIQSVQVVVADGNAHVDVAALNVERMSPWTFGSKMADTDDDDDLETVDHTDHTSAGQIRIHDLDSLGSAFDEAEIHNLDIKMIQTPSELPEEDVMVETTDEAPNPAFDGTATVFYRFNLPDAYDLSYTNPRVTDQQPVSDTALLSVEWAEGAGDTEFANISNSMWSDKTSLYSGEGSNVTIDSTIQPSQTNVYQIRMQLSQSQLDSLTAQAAGGGAFFGGQQGGGGGGGILGGISSWFITAMSGLAGMFGVRLWRNRGTAG